ncbi:AraC family transcriptional regulator [Fervidibacter sacchari]|uniref:AraC-like DNA-binding protein n=1 Tax=Candidatus Fervidibacter sacchari TaxID=1448929 RepID=A0ABT2EJS1_9BACT|nr:AraC family transcriptional regulator [Candidatus Fervidibacter sacchari]MCS3918090.1 AraC-like DNA-binding protein [Candidatus Fervidibacter sacchari]WKU15897.1 AraC family transcriptional regulator [Candidatus Fervidibacter sacchari]
MLPTGMEVHVAWATHHRWAAGQCLRRHPTYAYALWLVLSGTVIIQSEGQTWELSAGDALLFPPRVPRDIFTPHGAEWLSVGLVAQLFGRVDILARWEQPFQWRPEEQTKEFLRLWMENIIAFFPPKTEAIQLIVGGLAKALVGLLLHMLGYDHPTLLPQWLHQTLQRLQENPAISVTELALAAHFSPVQFRRQFRAWMGLTPREYLRRYRLELARRLLETTDLTIACIADQCGFESLSHFTRTFKSAFGAPPARYRKGTKDAKS